MENCRHSYPGPGIKSCHKGPTRRQQPNVYVLTNLMKVKMDVDYNPIIAPPKVEVEVKDDRNNVGDDIEGDNTTRQNKTQQTMKKLKFRSRSESPSRRKQTEEDFVNCKEWVERVNKLVTGAQDHIDAYQILLEYDTTHPPTYLIQGLLKTLAEMKRPDEVPKSPTEKGKTKDGVQNVNGQVVEEEKAEEEDNTENRMDEDQMRDLLNQISQPVSNNKRVIAGSKGQSSENTTANTMEQATEVRSKSKTEVLQTTAMKRSVGPSNDDGGSGESTLEKRARVHIDAGSNSFSKMKNASEPSCSSSSTSGSSSASKPAQGTVKRSTRSNSALVGVNSRRGNPGNPGLCLEMKRVASKKKRPA